MFAPKNTKKRNVLKNFQANIDEHIAYPHRLNFYLVPPQNEITLEEFEVWAIDRLYGLVPYYPVSTSVDHQYAVLGEIESSIYRNKTQKEMETGLKQLFEKYTPLSSNTAAHASRAAQLNDERKKDHYSHFILRLAFCRSCGFYSCF
jgi:DNA primase large subunit